MPSTAVVQPQHSPRPLRLEQAYQLAVETVEEIEKRFQSKYGRLPTLSTGAEFDELATVTDLNAEHFRSKSLSPDYVRGVQGSNGVSPYDFALILGRNALERGSSFAETGVYRPIVFDAFMGRMHYRPPPRERSYRMDSFDFLVREGLEAEIHRGMTHFHGELAKISEIGVHLDQHCSRETSAHFEDRFANPLDIRRRVLENYYFKNNQGISGVIKFLQSTLDEYRPELTTTYF